MAERKLKVGDAATIDGKAFTVTALPGDKPTVQFGCPDRVACRERIEKVRAEIPDEDVPGAPPFTPRKIVAHLEAIPRGEANGVHAHTRWSCRHQ